MTEPRDLDELERRREEAMEQWSVGDLRGVYDLMRDDVPALMTRVRVAEGARVLAVGLAEIAEARIAALEAALGANDAALVGLSARVQDAMVQVAALEAAARAVIDQMHEGSGIPRCCDYFFQHPHDDLVTLAYGPNRPWRHHPLCALVALAALLEERA